MTLAAPTQAVPAPDERAYRDALGRLATGVAFITAAPDGEPHRADRELARLRLARPSAGLLLPGAQLAHLVPHAADGTLRRKRAGSGARAVRNPRHPRRRDRFAGVEWEPGRSGAPLLTGALATLECEIVAEHPAGDQWIVVGRVDDLRTSRVKDPLVFFAGACGGLP
jgi:3-hydroxy-9,10-secoandrosta-1,3,5(10)-triene-9,17-dione monooxygenase reductase component